MSAPRSTPQNSRDQDLPCDGDSIYTLSQFFDEALAVVVDNPFAAGLDMGTCEVAATRDTGLDVVVGESAFVDLAAGQLVRLAESVVGRLCQRVLRRTTTDRWSPY